MSHRGNNPLVQELESYKAMVLAANIQHHLLKSTIQEQDEQIARMAAALRNMPQADPNAGSHWATMVVILMRKAGISDIVLTEEDQKLADDNTYALINAVEEGVHVSIMTTEELEQAGEAGAAPGADQATQPNVH